jgi:hypothetical protein
MSLAAAEAVGAQYAGVDLLPTTTVRYTSWRSTGSALARTPDTTDVDVAGAVVEHWNRSWPSRA